MNQITDEFIMAQQVAGKIVDRQRDRIAELERLYAHAQQLIAGLQAKLKDQDQALAAYQARNGR